MKYLFSYRCVRCARYPGLPVELKVIFEVLSFPVIARTAPEQPFQHARTVTLATSIGLRSQ
jgi:hypothetical protein